MPVEEPSTAGSPTTKPRVWPVFVGFFLVLIAINLVSILALGVSVGRAVLNGDVETSQLNGELLTSLLQELLHRPVLTCVISGLTSLIFMGYALGSTWIPRVPSASRLRLRRTTLPSLIFAAAGLFAISELLDTLVSAQNWLRFSHSLKQIQVVLWQMDGRWLPAAIMLFGVLPGLGEELFFRGFIQSRLSQRWGGVPAVITAAVLFGVAHGDRVHSPLAFLMGLALGVVVEWTGSLWPAITAHIVNNSLSVLGTLGYVQFNLPSAWKIGALAVLAVSAFLLLRPEPAAPAQNAHGASQATDWP